MNSCIKLLEETAITFPNKTAVVDDKKKYTFREMQHYGYKLSSLISEEYYNQPIVVLLPKTADSLIAFCGVMYSANFYVPLDTQSPSERIKKILLNLSPKVIITSSEFVKKIPDILLGSSVIIIDIDTIFKEEFKSNNNESRIAKVIDTDPIYCLYTSGSTGTPKGVLVPHCAILDMVNWAAEKFSINEFTNIGNQAPFFFDLSTIDIFLMLKTGATIYLIPQFLFSFPIKIVDYINENNINFICWVPSVFTNIANQNILEKNKIKKLKKITFIGEVMPTKTLNYWRKFVPDALYCNMYGPSETTFCSTYYIITRKFEDHEPLPIGFPCNNTDAFILDDNDKLEIEGGVGELCIRGTSLALGYWNDINKTKKVFVQNPLNSHYPERIYKTGDLVKYCKHDGFIFYGRKDYQIKHAGYRIELGEIENAVSSIDLIDQACVLYNKKKSEIVLFFVSNDNSVNASFFRKILVNLLPKYMLPNVYIKIEDIPLNANGKIDRVVLGKHLL